VISLSVPGKLQASKSDIPETYLAARGARGRVAQRGADAQAAEQVVARRLGGVVQHVEADHARELCCKGRRC
jgi:hypothetical protein